MFRLIKSPKITLLSNRTFNLYDGTLSITLGIICVLLHYVRIPIPGTIVPFVLQPLGALSIGIVFGPLIGLASQVVYALLLPITVWESLSTLSLLWGPTSGYIWGIVASSGVVGILWPFTHRTISRFILLTLTTLCCIHIPGISVLATWQLHHAPLTLFTLTTLTTHSLLPFFFIDCIKIIFLLSTRNFFSHRR